MIESMWLKAWLFAGFITYLHTFCTTKWAGIAAELFALFVCFVLGPCLYIVRIMQKVVR